ncbi:hypothetical protein [uncultured Brachyspira sp.]|uniref:hypothetical protein n=1 Tax=uncultured Brachyspira sp. TaxID=221953 RepID=UPI0026112C96|nr:hypothetical protein [uncultured Brachyspira sp.]
MEKLYYDFNKEKLEELIKKWIISCQKKLGDIENAFLYFSNEFINNKIYIGDFLQLVNFIIREFQHAPNSITLSQFLEKGIIKIKEHFESQGKKADINIYEILIYIYYTEYESDKAYSTAKELLEIDENNKTALLSIAGYEGEINDYKYEIIDAAIINNIAIYYSNKYGYAYYEDEYNKITDEKVQENINKSNTEEYFNKAEKYNKYLITHSNDIYNIMKQYNILEKPYIYVWCYYAKLYQHYLPMAQSNLGALYKIKYLKYKDIENYRNAEKLFQESIKNYENFYINIHPYIKDPIINLVYLYYENRKYKEAHKIIHKYTNVLPQDSDYFMLLGRAIYKEEECKRNADISLEHLKKSIRLLNFIDEGSFEYAMIEAFRSIMLIYEMQEKGHIHYDAARENLEQLYIYHLKKLEFSIPAVTIAFDIKAYELCSNIASYIIQNYNLDKDLYTIMLKYLLDSLHRANKDNTETLINIFNKEDFNNYELIINLINECAKSEVLKEDINIKNKNVLIDIYEIMSNTRKELVIMRLFDYVRNADAYAHREIDEDTGEEVTDRYAKWKGENLNLKYNNKEYVLCYHFHSSNEIEKDVNGNIVKDNRGKPLRRLPDKNWIAINQIRDSLAHRVNEKTSDVNEEIINAKKAREFINANFEYIIQCLFSVIIENNLLTDEQFRSDEF